jgi:hypothetical protein
MSYIEIPDLTTATTIGETDGILAQTSDGTKRITLVDLRDFLADD